MQHIQKTKELPSSFSVSVRIVLLYRFVSMREPMSQSSILATRHAIKRTGLQILSVFPGLFVDRDVDLFGKCRHVVLIFAVGIVANRDGASCPGIPNRINPDSIDGAFYMKESGFS